MHYPHHLHIYIAAVNQADSLSSAHALQQELEDVGAEENIRVSMHELLRTIADSNSTVANFYQQEMALAEREAHNPHALEQRFRQNISGTVVRMYRQRLKPLSQALPAYFEQNPAQLIVSTHPWLGLALHQARKDYGLKVPVLDFVSEPFSASPLWANAQANRWVMSSKRCQADLKRMGMKESRLQVVGYPLSRATSTDQKKTRSQLDLRDRFTVTLALHESWSVAECQHLIEDILEQPSEPFLIVIKSVSEELFEWLNQFSHPRLRVRNAMYNHQHHIAASDVLLCPASSDLMFTAASLGCPVVVTHYASLAQKRLIAWFEQKGLGSYQPKHRKILEQLERYHDTNLRQQVKAIGQRIRFRKRSQDLAKFIIKYTHIKQRPSVEDLL